MSAKKYRPYFTEAELAEIIRCVKINTTSLHLLQYLQSFQLKIQQEAIQPQYKMAPTIEDKLGISPQSGPSPQELLEKWKQNPISLTPSQIQAVQQYRWQSGLMTHQESEEYESNLFTK